MPIARVAGVTMAVSSLAAFSLTLAGGCRTDPPPPPPLHIAVPAYWSPAVDPGPALFEQLADSAPATRIVVVNGSHSAPEKPYHPAWADAIRTLDEAGIRPLGYVDTGYLGATFEASATPHVTRPEGQGGGGRDRASWLAQIEGDIEDWYDLYGSAGLGGIFLDQTVSVCGPDGAYADTYRQIVDVVKAGRPDAYVVMNPGRSVDECYADMVDLIVTFEGTFEQYLDRAEPPAWELAGERERFWHLIHGVPDVAGMTRVVELSRQRNAGYVYVTDDRISAGEHPWDTLPAPEYWRAQLEAVGGPTPAVG